METIGVPASSTARKHSSGVKVLLEDVRRVLDLPQPAQARLQRKSGSSMVTSGNRIAATHLLLQDVCCNGPSL